MCSRERGGEDDRARREAEEEWWEGLEQRPEGNLGLVWSRNDGAGEGRSRTRPQGEVDALPGNRRRWREARAGDTQPGVDCAVEERN